MSTVAESQSHYDAGRVTVIEAKRGWRPLDFRELWDYRELLFFLVWRDVKIRYKQTAVGAAWVALQPALTALIFTIILGHYAKLQSNVPYMLLTLSAFLPWFLFANALAASTKSIVENQALVTKVYIPRIMLPVAPVLAGLVDMAVGFCVLAAVMAYYGTVPSWHLVFLPFFVLFAVSAAIAVTIWLSALNVKYRDVQYTVPFLVQAWFFVTPVAFSAAIFPLSIRPWIGLNPMAGVVQGFRWTLFGNQAGQVGHLMLLSFGVVLVLLVLGIEYFRRVERSFADVV